MHLSFFFHWIWWFIEAMTWGLGHTLPLIQSWETNPPQAIRLHLLLLESWGALSLMYRTGDPNTLAHAHTQSHCTCWCVLPLFFCKAYSFLFVPSACARKMLGAMSFYYRGNTRNFHIIQSLLIGFWHAHRMAVKVINSPATCSKDWL